MNSGHPVVDAVGQMHLEGNIIPHSWYQCAELRHPSGKPNMVAIILLSDILYWYRPTVVRDEATGHIREIRKKFRDTMLHKDYAIWGQMFGFTKRQVQDAVKFLKDAGLVRQELRDVTLSTGARVYNAVFLEPIPAEIARITFEIDFKPAATVNVTPPPLERDTPHVETGHLPRSIGTPPPLERDSCTETTSEISDIGKVSQNSTNGQRRYAPEVYAKVLAAQKPAYRASIEQDARGIEKYLEKYHADELRQTAERHE